jgi:predicted TIM-barrel fold metal-dependent hydrolase
MPSQIFDIHPHIVCADTDRYPVAPLGGKRSDWSSHRPVDFEALLDEMNQAGVDKAAIVHSSTTYGYDASYLADAIADHHDRFTGVFSVDVQAPDAVEKIGYWIGRGLSGLRLFAAGSTVSAGQEWIADPSTYPAWRYCSDNAISVAISMRQEGLPYLIAVLRRFPDVKVVLDHLLHAPMDDGPPYVAAAPLWAMGDHPNVYMKLTTALIRRSQAAPATPDSYFGKLLAVFGSERIAWGSNFPAVTGHLPDIVAEAKAVLSILPAEDQENIFWRTAAGLYPDLVKG